MKQRHPKYPWLESAPASSVCAVESYIAAAILLVTILASMSYVSKHMAASDAYTKCVINGGQWSKTERQCMAEREAMKEKAE